MFGEGLTWQESVPAQVGAILGMQTANLAVHGYGNDQAYLRLQTEIPNFRRPVAVVSLFMTALFGRNLDQDRPHLGPGLVWLPAQHGSRLASFGKLFVPYRADATVQRGVKVTREVFRATSELARAQGATPLLVVLQFGNEEPPEQVLRRQILDDAGFPYMVIEIDPAWRLPWNRHPDARAARAIAVAIAAELGERLSTQASATDRPSQMVGYSEQIGVDKSLQTPQPPESGRLQTTLSEALPVPSHTKHKLSASGATDRVLGFLANFVLADHRYTIIGRPSGSHLFLATCRQFMRCPVIVN